MAFIFPVPILTGYRYARRIAGVLNHPATMVGLHPMAGLLLPVLLLTSLTLLAFLLLYPGLTPGAIILMLGILGVILGLSLAAWGFVKAIRRGMGLR